MMMNQAWSHLQDKLFEQALVLFPEHTSNRWELIAAQVPGKSPAEIGRHYEDLVHDVTEIECGRIELPRYEEEEEEEREQGRSPPHGADGCGPDPARSRSRTLAERRKGVPWTEEEHRLFLMGLQRYGKGDWRSISRNAVVSRTPTQVASHAQKYFLRQSSVKKGKDKRRTSIHDVSVTAAAHCLY